MLWITGIKKFQEGKFPETEKKVLLQFLNQFYAPASPVNDLVLMEKAKLTDCRFTVE